MIANRFKPLTIAANSTNLDVIKVLNRLLQSVTNACFFYLFALFACLLFFKFN